MQSIQRRRLPPTAALQVWRDAMTSVPSRSRARTSLALGASLAALAISNPALAQDNPAPGAQAQAANPDTAASTDTSQAGQEIVVTAQFRAQNLQDTPLAITAVNAQMLEARSQTDITLVAAQAPSVTQKPQGAAYGP